MVITSDAGCLPDVVYLVVLFKSCAVNKISVLVAWHDIQLDKSTYLGIVKIANSITPLQIKQTYSIRK